MLDTDPFHALLFDPPGTYALTPFGSTHAVVLTGSPLFHTRAHNLFASFGSETGQAVPPLHTTDRADTVWFCQSAPRVRAALRLYLFARLFKAHARDVIDAEGDFVEVVCDDEVALWEQAEQLACDFIVSHMHADHRALPVYSGDERSVEHGMGTIATGEAD